MTTYKIAELEGGLLDAAVAKAEGLHPFNHERGGQCWIGGSSTVYEPSIEWAVGGPIIERERIDLIRLRNQSPMASVRAVIAYGPTPLIAAMRAYATSKFGNEIEL